MLSHRHQTHQSRGARGLGREGPPVGEQGGQLGTRECPADKGSCVLAGAPHLLHTLQSRGDMGHGGEGPPAGEQGGQLGTHE